MKKLRNTFLYSIQLPNKKAMRKLNRIGMDITVMYLLILLLIVTTPSIIDQLTTTGSSGMKMNFLFFLIYFFTFNYLPFVIIIFLFITLMAYIFTGIAKLLRRKVRFPMLWKLTVYTTTIPFLFYTCLTFFWPISRVFTVLSMVYIFLLMIKLITIYPKRRRRIRQ